MNTVLGVYNANKKTPNKSNRTPGTTMMEGIKEMVKHNNLMENSDTKRHTNNFQSPDRSPRIDAISPRQDPKHLTATKATPISSVPTSPRTAQ